MAFKAAAAQRRFDIPNMKSMSPPASPASVSAADGVLTPLNTTFFPGNTQTGCAFVPAFSNFATPSDMGLAVGDTNVGVLQVNNVCISVFTKAGVLQPGFPKPLTAFAGAPLTANSCVADPRALYDWANHRYIISFIQIDCSTLVGSYWIAVGAGDNPAGVYHVFNLPSIFNFFVPALPDFPRLGQDRQAIYVASNVFNLANGAFLGEEWLLLPKSAMYAGAGFIYNEIVNPFGLALDTSQPANVWDNTDNLRTEFFVTSLNTQGGFYFGCLFTTGCNGLIVWAVSNPLDTTGPGPELSAVFVPTFFNYFFPPFAGQQGLPLSIDTDDVRISGEVTYGGGSLYAALTTADGTGAASSIMYKIQPVLGLDDNVRCTGGFTNFCPFLTNATMINENFLFYGGGFSAYYPTQQPDPEGNVTTAFNFSGPTAFGSSCFISQRVTQGVGPQFDNFVDGGLCFFGLAAYTQVRWGDYTAVGAAGIGGTHPSPTMWFAGMVANGDGSWGTTIAKNGFTTPDQP